MDKRIKKVESTLDINASTSKKIKSSNSITGILDHDQASTSKRKKYNCEKKEFISLEPSTSKGKRQKGPKVTDELRRLVILALEAGTCSRKTAASSFNLPYSTVLKIYKQFLDTGEIEGKPRDSKPFELQKEHVQFVLDALSENCRLTLKELQELTQNKFSIKIPSGAIANNIPTFHYNLKRILNTDVASVTPEIINDHREYCELFLQLKDSGRLLIYFDETEFQVIMRRFPEKEPLGQQILGVPPPSVRIRNKTIMASLTQNELLYYKSYSGPGNSDRLLEYLNALFLLLSDRNVSGAVLIMGNAAFSYCQEIAEATQLAGHEVIFLPACSPFLNPVENMFSQWIHFIRSKNPVNERELEGLMDTFEGVMSIEQCQYFCRRMADNATSCVHRKLIYTK